MRFPLAIPALLSIFVPTVGCTSAAPSVASEEKAPAPVSLLAVEPAAVRTPDAPGLNVEDLAARLRDVVQASSGVEAVDELSVRRELAACTEAPCPEVVAVKYREAAYVVGSSVSRLGDVFLSSVRIQRGAHELARATAQHEDPRRSLENAGREAGELLRRKLLDGGAQERIEVRDGEREGAPADTERGGEES